MADYYTKFSVVINLSKVEAEYALDLHTRMNQLDSEAPFPATFPPEFNDESIRLDWVFDCVSDADGIWISSYEGGLNSVIAFIQHLLAKFHPKDCVELEWSNDCSKPRTDAYGGGAAFITADGDKYFSTSQWLSQCREQFKKEQVNLITP